MADGDLFAVVDVGSARIKTLVGTFSPDPHQAGKKQLNILGVGSVPSQGIRKGTILDMEEFKKNLDESLSEAENMSGNQFTNVSICLSGTSISVHQNKGMIAVPNEEISQDDVNRVLEMAQNGLSLSNQSILKIIPESFAVDLENYVKSPIGMQAKKLEVNAHVFSVSTTVLSNVKKGFTDIGIDANDIYPTLLAGSESVLSRRQKELGVVCIDIGSSTTGITVYEEGVLRHAAVIPVGGEYVTSDVALGTRVSIDLAEKLKLDYVDLTFCDQSKPKDEEIALSKYDKKETEKVSKMYLAQIAQARYKEILHMVNRELKTIGKDGMLPEGAVFIGGGAKAKNLIELAKAELRLPCSIGLPEDHEFITGTSVSDPTYAGAVGTLLLLGKYGMTQSGFNFRRSVGNMGQSMNKLFKKLLP